MPNQSTSSRVRVELVGGPYDGSHDRIDASVSHKTYRSSQGRELLYSHDRDGRLVFEGYPPSC